MATATKDTVTLTLTTDEAADLRFVLGFIGGGSHYGETTRHIFSALGSAGVPWAVNTLGSDHPHKPVAGGTNSPFLMFHNG